MIPHLPSGSDLRESTSLRGRARAAAPLCALLVCGLGVALPARALDAQGPGAPARYSVEVRVGALYSSPLVEATVGVPAEPAGSFDLSDATLGKGLRPYAGLSVLRRMERWALEVRAGGTAGKAKGSGPGGDWDSADLVTVHVMAGVRYRVRPGLEARGGIGRAFYSADDLAILSGGYEGGVLVGGGGVLDRPSDLPLLIDFEVQVHSLGSPALRAAGGSSGSVRRFAISVGVPLGGSS